MIQKRFIKHWITLTLKGRERGRGTRTKGPGGWVGDAWEGSLDQGAGRKGGRGWVRSPRSEGEGGGLVERGEEVPGPWCWEKGCGRQGKESRELSVWRRAGEVREGVQGPGKGFKCVRDMEY